jgi:hypothetical protein
MNSSTNSLGVINIAIDEASPPIVPQPQSIAQAQLYQQQSQSAAIILDPQTNTSPRHGHSRSRASISESVNSVGSGTGNNVSAKIRGVRERLRDRSASRQRARSPQRGAATPQPYGHMPYESVPDFQRIGSVPLAQSSSEQAPLLTLPTTTYNANANPNAIPRGPKEIRAAMSAEQLQFGMDATERPNTVGPSGYKGRDLRANMPPTHVQPGVGQPMDGTPF